MDISDIHWLRRTNKSLEKLLDSLIEIVKIGQESDGYLTTWRTINPAKPPADWVKTEKGQTTTSIPITKEMILRFMSKNGTIKKEIAIYKYLLQFEDFIEDNSEIQSVLKEIKEFK